MGAEFFVEVAALGLGFEDAVGEGEDLRGRAVVGLDAVDDGAGMTLGERHDVFEIGATPRVDALRVVADGHHAVVGGELVHDLGLERVGVLILVHEDVAETVGEVLGDLGGVGEELEPEFEQVVVVHDVLLALLLGIGGGEGREAVGDLAVLGELVGDRLGEGKLGVAGEREDAEERAGAGVGLVLEEHFILRLDDLLEEGFGLVGIEDGEILRQPDGLAVHTEGAVADAVERAAPEAAGLVAGELLHAVEHFLGGFVGEREEQDFPRLHALRDQVGDAVGEGAGLARAGAGEDKDGAGGGGDGGELLVVEERAEIDGRKAGRAGGSVEFEIHAWRTSSRNGAGAQRRNARPARGAKGEGRQSAQSGPSRLLRLGVFLAGRIVTFSREIRPACCTNSLAVMPAKVQLRSVMSSIVAPVKPAT